MSSLIIYIIISTGIVALCLAGMAIGLIFRNKPIRACGQAARDFDGQTITCAVCGRQGDEVKRCRRQQETAEDSAP